MAEFKCISCGEVKESEKVCNCPVCGYRMFQLPYQRKIVLIKEIQEFIGHLKVSQLSDKADRYYRKVPVEKADADEQEKYKTVIKKTDDTRFPDYEAIQEYVCHSQKTEEFIDRLQTSLDQIRKHLHEEREQEYFYRVSDLKNDAKKYDETLIKAIGLIGETIELAEINYPDPKVDFRERPNEALLQMADKILDELMVLSGKIKKFIRQNNIYGTAYQYCPKRTFKRSEAKEDRQDLEKCYDVVHKTVNKNYVVDLLEDGTSELHEMLRAVWYAVDGLMIVPVRQGSYVYTFDDGVVIEGDTFKDKILGDIAKRYAKTDEIVFAFDFLEDRTEDEIFALYNQMIDLDSFGFMGINREDLLTIGESENRLNDLIGLTPVKESIRKIKAYAIANKDTDMLNLHMCFYGNPGTGKTEVARIIAGILYENKILPTKKVVEVDRGGLVGQYVGETPQKTMSKIYAAMGGVLFVDEAYALVPKDGSFDYGNEAVATLIKAMEDYRGKFCVILAGYKNEMQQMLSTNPGFKSRIQFELEFPNYSRDELRSITEMMLHKRGYTMDESAMSKILDITDVKRKEPNFANAREIRNILDQVIMCQNVRCMGTDNKELGLADVHKYIQDAKINLPTSGDSGTAKILTGEEELDQLIGLATVKRMVKKIKAYAKKNKDDAAFNLHMCFLGNPGTGKTEVARIISRILYDAGVLAEAKLVETDAHGLIGKYVGQTGPKTHDKINEAMNGVLFIDEAYGLTSGETASGEVTSYGEEAIAVLLKEMEDHRGQFCVILAGYQKEMKSMLSSNPGLESRVQFTLEFPDYTREELGEIATAFLKKKKYEINQDALERLLDVTDYFRNQPNFANARTVRNILDQVIMNQNLRTEESDDNTVCIEDVEDYLMDEKIDLKKPVAGRKIGFA